MSIAQKQTATQSQKLMIFVLSMSLYGLATLFTELIPKFQVGVVEFSVEYFLFIPLTLAMLFDPLSAALEAGQLTAVNTGRAGWEDILSAAPNAGKKRLNILAIGDVGSTLLTGLKLLGGGVLSSIGICDVSDQVTARWEFEMGQINLPWDYNAFPDVEVVPAEKLFDCDVFVFVASRGIPPVGSKVKDVRMAQFETNAAIVKQYAKMARAANFQGLWCAVSDPVDPLAKTAYLESNKDENGNWDGRGLRPEQVQGFGLGVMNARAAYYAKQPLVSVAPYSDQPAYLAANALAGTDRLEIYCSASPDGSQMLLISLFDNLGKGSSGAAVQCMNIMLGLEETAGLE